MNFKVIEYKCKGRMKRLAITVLFFMAIAITGGWLLSNSYRKSIIKHQQETIEVQKDLKESLQNQIEYIEGLNNAFNKTVENENKSNPTRLN